MKTQKLDRKLVLQRETIQSLDTAQLANANGGITIVTIGIAASLAGASMLFCPAPIGPQPVGGQGKQGKS